MWDDLNNASVFMYAFCIYGHFSQMSLRKKNFNHRLYLHGFTQCVVNELWQITKMPERKIELQLTIFLTVKVPLQVVLSSCKLYPSKQEQL